MAERYDTKSNVKLDGFRSQLQSFSYTEDLWYNETVWLWLTIYVRKFSKYLLFIK